MGLVQATYKKNCSEPYFSLIKNGKKTVEGRLFKDDVKNMKTGDLLIIVNPETKEEIKCKIKDLTVSKSFEDLYDEFGTDLLPDTEGESKPWEIYYKFYKRVDEKEYGVIGIKIELV